MAFRILFAATCLIALPATRAAETPDDLGAKVLKSAKESIGKKVGDGECAALAMATLEAAGAKTTVDFGVSGETRTTNGALSWRSSPM